MKTTDADEAFKSLKEQILAFRDARDWSQFHNPKDLAIALSVEAAELLEAYLWKKDHEASTDAIRAELADVIIYAILFADSADIDIADAVRSKLEENGRKYPVGKAKGSARKYTEL